MRPALFASVIIGALTVASDDDQAAVALALQGKQPRAAVNRDAAIAVVYGQGNDIYCRISKDGGTRYGEPTRVGSVERLMLGMRRGPQIAAVGSSFVVTASGREGGLTSWRSSDGARSWTGPVLVNDRPASAREGLHGLAGGSRILHVVWLDLRDGRTKIFSSRSLDEGKTWEANRLVYESPDGTVCECCQPTVAADDKGEVVVMWRNSLAGARDMFIVRSRDDGRTFRDAEKLGKGTWPLKGCPMDGGGVAVDGGRVATAWRREEVVYSAAPGEEEASLGRGRNAAVAFGPGGAITAWQSAEGDILLKQAGSAPEVVGRGRFPSFGVAAGAKGPLVVVWEDPESGAMARVLPRESRRGAP